PEMPFTGFAETAKRLVRGIIVSVKPDHGLGGALHEETAYGIVRDTAEAKVIGNLVTRKPVTALSAAEVDSIRDLVLRRDLQEAVAPFRGEKGKVIDEKGFRAALATFAKAPGQRGRDNGVRRVRIGKTERDFISIGNRQSGIVYKALIAGENH